ncbi:restriction endonuclease subunit S [Pseudomonas sp. CBC3]
MKDSGVEWLGEVPAHWTVAPIKFFFEFLDGQRIPIKAEDRGAMQGDYPYYGASGIIDYVNDFIFEEDLVLVSEDGANLLMRSTPIAFVAQGKYWVNNHAHIIRPQDDSLTYWVEVIEQQDLTNYVTGSAQPKLTAEALGSIKIAVPPTGSERAAIQAFILEIDAELGALLTEAACGVRLLQERRSALISAAVTGKIDVRGWQPPVSTPATEPAVAEAV